jgi:hypothetical protein
VIIPAQHGRHAGRGAVLAVQIFCMNVGPCTRGGRVFIQRGEDCDPVRLCEGGQGSCPKKRRVARRRRAAGGSPPPPIDHTGPKQKLAPEISLPVSPARALFLFGSGRGRARRLRRPDASAVETDPVASSQACACRAAGRLVCSVARAASIASDVRTTASACVARPVARGPRNGSFTLL